MLATALAVATAAFYALNVPFSKLLLEQVPPTYLAALLYLGAGAGVGCIYAFRFRLEPQVRRLSKRDLPYTFGMIALDIAAPILLMLGVQIGTATNASLLGNFEIVAMTLIALLCFHETVSSWLWAAISCITAASAILSFQSGGLHFSAGSLLVLGATVC